MGDFDLTLPRRQNRYSLGDYQLVMDPRIEAAILELRTQPPAPVLRNLFVSPNWELLQESQLDAALGQPPAQTTPLVPRGAGPATARPGKKSDVMGAIWGVPAVRQASERVLDNVSDQLRRDWNRLSTGERVLVISHGAVLAGGTLAAVLNDDAGRQLVLDLISDRDIPIPGVNGLTVRVNRRGGGATYRGIAGSGVTVQASGGVDQRGRPEYNVNVSLDVMQFLP